MVPHEMFSLIVILISVLVIILVLSLLSRCSMYLKKILAEIKDLNKKLTPPDLREMVCSKCSKTISESEGKKVAGKVLCPKCADNDVTVTMG